MTLSRFFIAGLVVGLSGLPALAAPNPDFVLKTKTVDVSIILDTKIKADPALAADCLADGKHYAEKRRQEADADRRSGPNMFPSDGYTYERRFTVRSVVAGRYVSVVRDDYMNTHGAHPNTDVNTIIWDRRARERISIRPFFKELASGGPTLSFMLTDIITALKTEKKKRGVDEAAEGTDWYKDLKPDLLKIGAVTLTPSTEAGKSAGLSFHYPPYAVGPYAEGQYVAFLPWRSLKPYLSAEGDRIFGGARPAGGGDGTR
ncbi:MAG TPA: RsiV family protein [Nitrobacter sp.]|jgi:hypothetical protein|nr:RsiV family protein [Nitrobacter sp.]